MPWIKGLLQLHATCHRCANGYLTRTALVCTEYCFLVWLQVVINNAGILGELRSFEEITEKELQELFQVCTSLLLSSPFVTRDGYNAGGGHCESRVRRAG